MKWKQGWFWYPESFSFSEGKEKEVHKSTYDKNPEWQRAQCICKWQSVFLIDTQQNLNGK